jgi:DNA-binding transcriptional ArsR family regulator
MDTRPGSPRNGYQSGTESDRLKEGFRRAADLLKHASDPTRVQIILLLAKGEIHVKSICRELGMRSPAVSHHLAKLRSAGLAVTCREGQRAYYCLTESGGALAEMVKGIKG